jgi:hypothetical protein
MHTPAHRPPLLLRRMKDDCLEGSPQDGAPYPRSPIRSWRCSSTSAGSPCIPQDPASAARDEACFKDCARLATLFRLLGEIAGKRRRS